jgi:Domain of unknown function (DUF4279)
MEVRMPRVPRPTLPKDTAWFGGHPDRAKLCLRVCGDGLDPDEVTRLLGRAPTRSRRKGQPVLTDTGEVKRIARTGSWLLDQPVGGDVTIDEAIESLLGSLPEDEQVWATLMRPYRIDLLCDVFVKGVNQGFELSPRVLGLLGRRGITLGVDIFCEPDEEQQELLKERLGTQITER